ncbi:MAG: hypothetical protein ACRD0W_07600 [Acidimicrobiales bacterium]
MPVIHVEPWPTTASGPYLIADEDEDVGLCQVVEGDGELRLLDPPVADSFSQQRVAFVDGVRRADARLYMSADGFAHGVAGAHGTGAVLCNPSSRPEFHECRVRRLVMWGSGVHESLPDQPGGWSWTVDGVADDQPDAPLNAVQRRMREAEGQLAEMLAGDGCLTIIDGPLNFVRSRDLPVVGFVKTHHRPLLPPEAHRRVPELVAGQRTSLFAKRADIYSCYLRLAAPPPWAGPWAGITRLEFPASVGLEEVRSSADGAAALLPRFAGIAHKDGRAPQNLLPISQLERHLRRLLGDGSLAIRAIRSAVVVLSKEAEASA